MNPEKTSSILSTKLLHVWRYWSSQESGCLVFTRPNMALPKNNQKFTGSLLPPPQNNSSALTYSVFGLMTHSWKQNNSDGDQSQQKDVRVLGCTWFLTEMKSSGYSPFIPLKWQLSAPPSRSVVLLLHTATGNAGASVLLWPPGSTILPTTSPIQRLFSRIPITLL